MSEKISNSIPQPFFWLPNDFVDFGHLAVMGGSSFLVYCSLLRHSNTNHECFPSYSKIEEETGLARASVSKSIKFLVSFGYIRQLEIGTAKQKATLYEIMDLSLVASSKNELVQKMNWFKNNTSTSSKFEPQLVQNLNSNNTNRKKHIQENTYQDKMGDRFNLGKPKNDYFALSEDKDFKNWLCENVLQNLTMWKTKKPTDTDALGYILKARSDTERALKINGYFQEFQRIKAIPIEVPDASIPVNKEMTPEQLQKLRSTLNKFKSQESVNG